MVVEVAYDDVGAVSRPVAGEGGAEAGGSTGYEDGEIFDGGGVDGLGEVDGWGLNAVHGDVGGCSVTHVGR